MKDLSKATNLAVPTISRIINNKENCFCSQQKRDEVLRLARELNYQPNIGYRIMTGMPTGITAIIFSQERVAHEEHILNLSLALTRGLEEQDYAVYSAVMTADTAANLAKIQKLESRGCRGFLLIGTPLGHQELVEYMRQAGCASIFYTSAAVKREKIIHWDEGAALRGYMRHFRENGIDSFKLVAPEKYIQDRLPDLLASGDADFQQKLTYIAPDEFQPHNSFGMRFKVGYQRAEAEYRANPGIKGMIFISDYHALGAAAFFRSQNLESGRDILLCGMYNSTARRFSGHSIISSDFDIPRVAGLMLEHLLDEKPVEISVTPKIVMGELASEDYNEQ